MQNFLSKEYMYRILVEILRGETERFMEQCTYNEYKFLIIEL